MPNQDEIERLQQQVVDRFGVARGTVRTVFSPYRICPLGAHVDHQLGRVTAMALDRGVLLAFSPSGGRQVRLESLDFPGRVAFDLDDIPDRRPGDWGNFARGAARALRERHPLTRGLAGITSGSVAEGGLSSSAAVGVAYLLALEAANELQLSAEENIRLDQTIENTYLGLQNGVLDQSAILLSRAGRLTVLDCATLEHELVEPPASMVRPAILIASSGLRKALVGTDYNRRVAECREAARLLLSAAGRPDCEPLLGNVTDGQYAEYRGELTGPAARRAEHFFTERRRVGDGVDAWRRGDIRRFGRLITLSGASSIDNYECGAPPLVDLYHLLIETDGVLGARFSGAGFRGCCVALVDPAAVESAAERVHRDYTSRHGDLAADARVFHCTDGDGARIL